MANRLFFKDRLTEEKVELVDFAKLAEANVMVKSIPDSSISLDADRIYLTMMIMKDDGQSKLTLSSVDLFGENMINEYEFPTGLQPIHFQVENGYLAYTASDSMNYNTWKLILVDLKNGQSEIIDEKKSINTFVLSDGNIYYIDVDGDDLDGNSMLYEYSIAQKKSKELFLVSGNYNCIHSGKVGSYVSKNGQHSPFIEDLKTGQRIWLRDETGIVFFNDYMIVVDCWGDEKYAGVPQPFIIYDLNGNEAGTIFPPERRLNPLAGIDGYDIFYNESFRYMRCDVKNGGKVSIFGDGRE